MAELWDIYNEKREKTGKLHERGLPLSENEYHLVVHIWVRNPEGKYLITKREQNKEPFPGKWECTGGSAIAGETSLAAALRETLEETGIDHRADKKTVVLSYIRKDWIGDVWLFETDHDLTDITLQKGETTDSKLVSKEEILQMKKDGTFCPYDYIEKLMEKI